MLQFILKKMEKLSKQNVRMLEESAKLLPTDFVKKKTI